MMRKTTLKTFCAILCVVLIATLVSVNTANANTKEIRYADFATVMASQSTTENVTYTNKSTTTKETVKGVPKYKPLGELENSCGATAGSIVVGFYDKYFENLIPNYTTYVSSGTYKGRDSVYIPTLMRELYTLMRTNVDDVGVSMSDCLDGLKTYINGKGYSVNYNSVKGLIKVNESKFTKAIENNHPILLFCTKMDLYSFSTSGSTDTLVCTTYDGAHVCVAYGFFEVNYYNSNGLFRTDKYAHVATGISQNSGYLKLSSTDWCVDAYEVTIS